MDQVFDSIRRICFLEVSVMGMASALLRARKPAEINQLGYICFTVSDLCVCNSYQRWHPHNTCGYFC